MKTKIRLTTQELEKATKWAIDFWNTHNKGKGMNHGANAMYRSERKQFSKCLMGFRAELAVAKALGLEWKPETQTANGPDIGDDIQVKAVSHPKGMLIVRPSDKKYGRLTHRFILVYAAKANEYHIVGWLYGMEAVKDENWTSKGNGRPAAWFVSQDNLKSMDTFNDEVSVMDIIPDAWK
jgi:hypothetical protein